MPTGNTDQPAHAGQHLLNRTARFALKHSDQANVWNRDDHDRIIAGPVLLAYDDNVVVRVSGWQFAHTVRAEHITPIGEDREHVYGGRVHTGLLETCAEATCVHRRALQLVAYRESGRLAVARKGR
jgi:hypothetical protein